MKKSNSGITLVALVITIIVLIILAGVSINAVFNDGLIGNAQKARDSFTKEKDAEELELAKLEGILAAETLKLVKAGDYTGEENCRYVEGGKTAIIPAGFTVSNVASEKTIAGGLVIYSMDSTTAAGVNWTTGTDANGKVIQETYNQYVWIPVENPSDMYGTLELPVEGIEGTKFGKLYDVNSTKTALDKHCNWPTETGYSATSNKSYREPEVLSEYDTNASYYKTILGYNSVEEYKAGIVQEFNDMITSVEKYKGFYIGRYELTGTAAEPTVKKGLNPLVSTNWYNFYKSCTNLETGNTNAKEKVRTTMVWGCQWDQAVKVTLNKVTDFLTNAKAYGVYSDSEIASEGATGRMAEAYNIYDMGGNVWDWTLEAIEDDGRGFRGASYLADSSAYQASCRYERYLSEQ